MSERLYLLPLIMEMMEMKQAIEQIRNEQVAIRSNLDALEQKIRAGQASQAEMPTEEEVQAVLADMKALNERVVALLGV